MERDILEFYNAGLLQYDHVVDRPDMARKPCKVDLQHGNIEEDEHKASPPSAPPVSNHPP